VANTSVNPCGHRGLHLGHATGHMLARCRGRHLWVEAGRYLPTSGASFSPESATNMGKALDGAVDILGIGPDDETKREAVARFIIKLAEIDGGVDEARGGMSRRAAARRYEISESVAIKWLERVERDGSRKPVGHGGHRASKLMPHRDFLEAARTEKSDITLSALCDRLWSERGVKADTSMMSRFFRRLGVTFKKRRLSRASRTARTSAATVNDGEPIRAASIPGDWCSSTRPGRKPT
jgi:transposase